MPRLRNEVTGAVVSVSDSTAARLGGVWGPADKAAAEPKESTSKRRGAQSQKADAAE